MKKSFIRVHLLLLISSASSLQATVAPVTLGEGIWNVLTRVAFAASYIEGATGCYYFIRQQDIPLTITQPGNYCLDESIVFNGTAVTINSSDVNFDMNGYSMDANFATNSVAFRLNSGDNISITNGLIQNTTSGAILSSSTPHRNIMISDLDIVQNLVGIVLNTGMNVEGLLIENCYFSNGGDINIQGSGIAVRNCDLDDSFTGTGSASISIRGLSDARLARHIIVEDCSITGSTGGDSIGITIQLAKNAMVNNCIVNAPIGLGIQFAAVNNLRCSNCFVTNTTSIGITARTLLPFITPINSALIENCIVLNAGFYGLAVRTDGLAEVRNVSITDCIVSNGIADGILIFTVLAPIANVSIKRCVTSRNLALGGIHIGDQGDIISNAVIKDCTAVENSFGFPLVAAVRGVRNVILTRCTAQGSLNYGFSMNTSGGSITRNVIVDHCISQHNALNGFDASSTSSMVQIINCCSERNNVFGYRNLAAVGTNIFLADSSLSDQSGGFSGVSASLIKTGAAAVSAATYWNNVTF